MRTQTEIFHDVRELIPATLCETYAHLSYGEMAEVDELAEWAEKLRLAESDWFKAEENGQP